MTRFLLILLTLTALCASEVAAKRQRAPDAMQPTEMQPLRKRNAGDVRMMFFNLENFFVPFVDSTNLKREFSPTSIRRWNWDKFKNKSNGIYKVIAAIGETAAPDFIGVCEIENRQVLNLFLNNTPLQQVGYGIVHQDSPDLRGIDVALLYRKSVFTLLDKQFITVRLRRGRPTRDILYAKGVVNQQDTLHIVVVHAPSKYGGAAASEPSRGIFADSMQHFFERLARSTPRLNLVIMGDFNDSPESHSYTKRLRTSAYLQGTARDTLYNLAMPSCRAGKGTIKYHGKWEMIDLVFVSGNLLDRTQPLHCVPEDYRIIEFPFLFEDDPQYAGLIPHRTYLGMKYNGGISDHLPVVLDLRSSK